MPGAISDTALPLPHLFAAAAVVIPVIFLLVLKRLLSPPAAWSDIAEIKTGSARWTPRPGATLWLDGDWEAKTKTAWHKIKLPCDLASVPGLPETGAIVFRRHVKRDDLPRKGRLFLGIPGAGGSVRVSVNGDVLASRAFGLLPFEIELPEKHTSKATGQLEISIEVKRDSLTEFKNAMSLGPEFAVGLFRDIYIQARPLIFIGSMYFDHDDADCGELVAEINGTSGEPVAISMVLEDKSGNRLAAFDRIIPCVEKSDTAKFRIPHGILSEWTIEKPVLYVAKASIISGDISDKSEFTFGLCNDSLKYTGTGPASTPLVGAIRSAHYPPYGAAIPWWAMKKDIEIAKEIGLSLLWATPIPFHPAFVSLCDELGMRIVQELPLNDIINCVKSGDKPIDMKTPLLEAANHPSFAFWHVSDSAAYNKALAVPGLGETLLKLRDSNRLAVSGEESFKQDFRVEKTDNEVFSFSRSEYTPSVPASESGRILVFDFFDGAFGSAGSTSVEAAKAISDEMILKCTKDSNDPKGIVLGRLFGWGFRPGLLSASRRRKLSADVAGNFLKSGRSATPDMPHRRPPKSTRTAAVFSAPLVVIFLLLQKNNAPLLIIHPSAAAALISVWALALLKLFSFSTTVAGIAGYIEANPDLLAGMAKRLTYPVFSRLASGTAPKSLIAAAMIFWGNIAAYAILLFAPGMTAENAFEAICLAGIAEAFLAFLPFSGFRLSLPIAVVAIIEAMVMSQFAPAGFAFSAAIVMWLPAAAVSLLTAEKHVIT